MDTPALAQLMGAYLHQDYDIVGTVEDNVDLFVRDSPDLAALLPGEVSCVLSETTSEAGLRQLLIDVGCQLRPPGGTSYRAWLTDIADHVRRAQAGGE